MLLRNGLSLTMSPCRFRAAPGAYSVNVPNQPNLGLFGGAGTVSGGVGNAKTAAVPNGYEPPYCWILARKGGGLSAYNTIEGTGSLTITALSLGKDLGAALTGSGTISAADLALIVSMAAALSGSGDISAATLQTVSGLIASLDGSGDISAAALSLIVSLEADLLAAGDISATLSGFAVMSADIVVTGTGLSTANVGAAVWAELLEGSYSAEQMMRLLAAVLAGKSSGHPTSPVFRSLDDTADRVSGTVDASGNRTAVVLNP